MNKKINAKSILFQLTPLFAIILFIVIWLVVAKIVNAEIIIPEPKKVFSCFFKLLTKNYFWSAVGNTIVRAIISFAIALVVGGVLAILSFIFPIVKKILSPLVVITRATPTMSIILLAIIWLTEKTSPIFISFLVIFPLLYSGFLTSIENIDGNLLLMAKLYKVPKQTIVKDLYIKTTLPSALDTIKSAISLNIKVIIAGEVLAQTGSSIGYYMQLGRVYLDTSAILAWTVVAIVLAFLLETLIVIIKKLTIRWK